VLSALIRLLVIAVVQAGGSLAHADEPVSAPAAALRAKYAALQEQLDHSPFQRPLYLDSTETQHRLQGELYGVLDDSFASARNSLKLASQRRKTRRPSYRAAGEVRAGDQPEDR